MKQIYLIFCFTLLSMISGYGQNCTVLGCAGNYGPQLVDATVPDAPGPATCYSNVNYKQAYWQFFYSPSGGNYTQTFTPTSTGDPFDLDYIVYDMGFSGPATVTCPVNTAGFSEVNCNVTYTGGQPTGPGIEAPVVTVAGHFYAIVVYAYQDDDPSYAFTIGTPQINGVNLDALNCPGVLPVKLTSFNARVSDCAVQLDWQSEMEAAFRHYIVEYSSNGRTYQPIATLPGVNNSNRYSFNHLDAPGGHIYYRLKMVNLSGTTSYSNTIAMNTLCGKAGASIYPNPVTDVLHVNLTNTPGRSSAILYNISGKSLLNASFKSGMNSINMATLPGGIYMLRIISDSGIQNIKIVK